MANLSFRQESGGAGIRHPGAVLLTLLFFCLFPAAGLLHAEDGAAFAEVVLINSFHPGHFWEKDLVQKISDELEKTPDIHIRLHCEYLDYERHPRGSLDSELFRLFARKYAGHTIAAVVITDNDALDFMLVYGDALFPGVPAVYCGIADPPAQLAERRAQYTGILENFSIRRILEALPRVHPAARHLAIVCGDTTSARTALRQALPDLEHLSGMEQIPLTGLTAKAMQQRLEALP